jgi:uncharacterized protein YraI
MTRFIPLLGCLILVLILCACGPSPEQIDSTRTQIAAEILASQTAESANRTLVAAEVYASQTADAPTAPETLPTTPEPTRTPAPTKTTRPIDTLTESPTDTPLAQPDAVITAPNLSLYDGPGNEFNTLDTLLQGDELEVIGQFSNCTWLKVIAPDATEGWVNGHIAYLQMNLACETIPAGTFRPQTGTMIVDRRTQMGDGELRVENGTTNDGVIILTDLIEEPVVAFYMRGGSDFSLTAVPDGDYIVFFSTGQDWDGEQKQFSTVWSYERFADTLNFTTSSTQYTIWTLKLHPTVGGEGKTEPVDPDQFPSLNE